MYPCLAPLVSPWSLALRVVVILEERKLVRMKSKKQTKLKAILMFKHET